MTRKKKLQTGCQEERHPAYFDPFATLTQFAFEPIDLLLVGRLPGTMIVAGIQYVIFSQGHEGILR